MDSEKVQLGKSYDPVPIEDKWYAEWIAEGFFKADSSSPKPPFSIVIPPPNVTGSLHVGHALDNTLQDILCRTKRMQGYEVLWLPSWSVRSPKRAYHVTTLDAKSSSKRSGSGKSSTAARS